MAAADLPGAPPVALAPPRVRSLRHRSLTAYLTAVVAIAAAVCVPMLAEADWSGLREPGLWALAGFVLLGELFPIRLPRRDQLDEITLSTPFAFALLLAYGPGPAIAVYAIASVLQDVGDRTAPAKVAFNAAQYGLSVAAAAGVMAATAGVPPLDDPLGSALPAVLAAAVAMWVVNQVLVGTATALATRRPVVPALAGDFAFQTWTAGFQLALGPIVYAVAEHDLEIVWLLFFPILAMHVGGRQAVLNQHRALHDELTELPNRRLFLDRLDDLRRERQGAVALLLDLDDFKAVNDTLGHQHGDHLLIDVAQRLEGALPADCVVARLGGDEFAVLAPRAPGEAVDATARRVEDALAEPFDLGGLSLEVRATMGVALYPLHGTTAEEVLKHADVALYAAKESGAPWALYAVEDDGHSLDRLALAGQLRRGIERGELVVHYQPKLGLRDGTRHGVEALVRWEHPQLGLIGPDGFIGLAEQSDLITQLTHVVLDQALEQCQAWRADGLELRMSVNVSARSLLDRGLADTIAALLERRGLPASALQVEITESRLVADLPRARATLEHLRRLGVAVAIDDFGTGFSSLAQLTRLPVDEIKIDKSFVLGMEASPGDAAIVRSTIELGRNLALRVTAEGVETREAFDRLAAMGCDYAQGFHVGRPAPAESCRREVERFFRSGRAAALSVVAAFALLAAAGGAVLPASAEAADPAAPYVVGYATGVSDPGDATTQRESALGFRAQFRYDAALRGFAARLTDRQVAALRDDPRVAVVAPDAPVQADGTEPLAAGESVPTGVARIGAAAGGLAQAPAGAAPAAAVLDTGIDLANPDLNAAHGVNCVGATATAQDDNGHGTHVAGTIGARNAGAGAVGVAPGARLYAVKVLNARKTGTLSQLLCGIDWVTRNAGALGIRVANMSISGSGADDGACGAVNKDLEHQAICSSTAAGVTYVASAGNAKTTFGKSIPAAYPEVLTATAMSDSDGRAGGTGPTSKCFSGHRDDSYATYSNYASTAAQANHTIAAPGTCILSTKVGGGTATMTGTSSSAPHVSGAAVLCHGSADAPGPCAGQAPAAVIGTLRARAGAVATVANGFAGDPLRPVTGKHFGHLVALP